MAEETLNKEEHKADKVQHWTEQAQKPAPEEMVWGDCLRAERPKVPKREEGVRCEDARAWAENPQSSPPSKGSRRQTAWILAALLIGLPLILLVLGSLLESVVAWIAVAVIGLLAVGLIGRGLLNGGLVAFLSESSSDEEIEFLATSKSNEEWEPTDPHHPYNIWK